MASTNAQVATVLKQFQSDLMVLKKEQTELYERIKKSIYDRKMAEITKNLGKRKI